MEKKKLLKRIMGIVIVVAIICLIFFAPPIMVVKGAIVWGEPTDEFILPGLHWGQKLMKNAVAA